MRRTTSLEWLLVAAALTSPVLGGAERSVPVDCLPDALERFDPVADQRDSWFGAKIGGTNFSISPGEGYFIQMTAGSTATVTPEHF